ncbi:MAG TPA: zinc dependent phospholipase C family protein [Anaerolineae bacterium]|nr:zinc dependent phospholipase C family protein [Anaerolineae bacterium]HQI83322.1 zinc dependent phospholipase C family protein [Anaerolineae bacterium]
MPTPFQHLVYARDVLNAALLPEKIRQRMRESMSAYLLGNTAVDVQSITGQPRFETHFYHVHGDSALRASDTLLAAHPHLADPNRLHPAHAAFVSGYLVHLAWDECWLRDVFRPFYMESALWPDRLTRNVHHNALRVLVDRQAEAILRAWPDLVPLLRTAQPDHWLPFVDNAALCRWRDWLVTQLADPAAVQTAQVFAERMGVSPEHLEAVIRAVADDTYTPPVPGLHVAIATFEACALAESVEVLKQYWQCVD